MIKIPSYLSAEINLIQFMKKLLLTIAVVATGFAAFAQKPAAGNITTEIGLSSLLGTPGNPTTSGVPAGMFRVRYFMADDMAIRAHFGFGTGTTTTKFDNAPATPVISGERKVTTTGFGIALGIEKHLEGTSALSPYIGAEFGFANGSSSTEATNTSNGATVTATGDAFKLTGGATTTIALNGLVGADYYITDKVYIGAEMGIGLFNMTSTGDTETSSTTGGVTTTIKTLGSSSNSIGLMPSVIGQVRVGIILF